VSSVRGGEGRRRVVGVVGVGVVLADAILGTAARTFGDE
jgi:hypothetical protein